MTWGDPLFHFVEQKETFLGKMEMLPNHTPKGEVSFVHSIYPTDQLCLPTDLEEDIPASHLVRAVKAAVNHLDDAIFHAAYLEAEKTATILNAYQVIIYAYMQRIYSSRQIAKAVRENIIFMSDKLEARLQEKPKDKPLKKAVRTLRKDLLPRLQKYETQEAILGARNSYSKTTLTPPFMRMTGKTHAKRRLTPVHNAQIGTENQFIIGYSLHQRPTDTCCLIPHLEKIKSAQNRHRRCGLWPKPKVIARSE